MLTRLRLQNFRCFEDHEIPLRPTTVIVGRNNAGKSTIVEALRLVSIVASRYRHLNYWDAPAWASQLVGASQGVAPSLKGMDIDLRSAFSYYSDPPAIIDATFADGATVTVFVGPDEELHCVIHDSGGRPVMNKAQAQRVLLPEVSIQPQVAPVQREEEILGRAYVRSMLASALAPAHFRNQLYWLSESSFEDFAAIAQATWPGLEIQSLDINQKTSPVTLSLLIREGDFVAEVGWMGHGIQMWLETMWFLARVRGHTTVILDEPDVYMHADLQRRLVRFLRGRHPQVIVATHSPEIMSEVDPDDVLVVDRRRSRSKFAGSVSGAQRAVDQLGSVHSLSLARLSSARRCILVEGDDLVLLKRLQDKIFPTSLEPFDVLPSMSLGGWSGWPYAIGSSMFLLKNAADQKIIPYCIFDSDYHPPDVIAARYREASDRGIELHVWQKKEIENYLLAPAALHRALLKRRRRGGDVPGMDQLVSALEAISEALKPEALTGFLGDFLALLGNDKHKQAYTQASAYLESRWGSLDQRLGVVSGKAVLSRLSDWAQTNYGITLSVRAILSELEEADLAPEVVRVISAIERRERLGSGEATPGEVTEGATS